jgi:hypothetical protein
MATRTAKKYTTPNGTSVTKAKRQTTTREGKAPTSHRKAGIIPASQFVMQLVAENKHTDAAIFEKVTKKYPERNYKPSIIKIYRALLNNGDRVNPVTGKRAKHNFKPVTDKKPAAPAKRTRRTGNGRKTRKKLV